MGEITHLTGRVLSPAGEPVRNAVVEIWQCDAKAHYIAQGKGGDTHFQGFGKFETKRQGRVPLSAPSRPVALSGPHPAHPLQGQEGREDAAHLADLHRRPPRQTRGDGVLRGAGGLLQRELVMADFKKIKGSKTGELACKFDMIVGVTPERR